MTDPLGLKFGKIVGRFLANVADGVDSDDLPEFEPLSGEVTIKAEPPKILVPQGDPDPTTVVQLPDYYVCTLDDQGYLSNQGERGVRVIAPTPGTTNPSTFTYRVSFNLYYGTKPVKLPSFSFYVTEYTPGPNPADPDTGSTGLTDLTKVSPVPGSLGNAVTAGVSVVGVALVGDALVFSLSDGSTLPGVPIPAITDAQAAADAAADSASDAADSATAAQTAAASFTLGIGTVTTGAPGSSAAASVTGPSPHWLLNLTLPQGATGPAGPPAPDATSSVKGILQLAGDLGGTAAAPTVPGLAGKANTVHTHTASQISDSTTTGRALLTATDATAARTAISAVSTSDTRLSDTRPPTVGTSPYDFSIPAFGKATTRAIGTGDFPFGVKLQRAVTLSSVSYRGNTNGGSGNFVVELRKNGSTVTGTSVTIAATSAATGGSATGTWAFAAGDILTVYITAADTSPGAGLIADIGGLA